MAAMNRREFLCRSKATGLGMAAGMTILNDSNSVRANPANDKIMMAIIGCRSRGPGLARNFARRNDCELAYIADVDKAMIVKHAPMIAEAQGGKKLKGVQDFRRVLEDKSVDAIIIATPTHWHAPATIWGCQAGKDVYVEKPLCHNAWEGQKMIEAARKYKRVVQVGTQNRSAPYNMAARKYITEGKLGKVHFVRVLNQKLWPNFKPRADQAAPKDLDWDMWNGPAPEHAYNFNLRYHWHHLWRYCIGDIGNDGAHQFDEARMIAGFGLPKHVHCTGGRWNTQGTADTPDTQIATFTYDNDMVATLELTLYTPYMLKIDPVVRDNDMFPYWPQVSTRIEIYGDKGVMTVGRMGGGWQVFVRTKDRKPVVKDQMYGRFPDSDHQENWVQCIHSREKPNADIEIGHISHISLHYATMSYRAGFKALNVDPKTQHVDDAEAMKFFKREEYRKPWVLEEEV
ncbi:MAG: Gfo/Idh/MocA family oxidoreductase [Pirellulales bacterium]|nr:Gfo/Idh/MocA family oxidoreductase [Pirellulales bacterium]